MSGLRSFNKSRIAISRIVRFDFEQMKIGVESKYEHVSLSAIADSIFFDNDRTLFATFKYVGTDFEGDMELMRANPKIREWWAMTDGMQASREFYMDREDEGADMGNPALGQPYTRSCEQCRWSRVVEGLGRGILHRVNHCIDMEIASLYLARQISLGTLIGERNL